jgi:hypothetical protein
MAARVIHFGTDYCHRSMVLRNAGFAVDECISLVQLRSALIAESRADVVCLSDGEPTHQEAAVALARSHCSAPLVFFQGAEHSADQPAVDLVVPNLTPPDVWLNEVKELIAQSVALQQQTRSLLRKSGQIRMSARDAVRKSREERDRSHRERERASEPEDPFGKSPATTD